MAIIAATLGRIKSDPLFALGGKVRVNEQFARSGHVWRDRVLDPAATLGLFILQVLHGNTAINHLRQLSGVGFAAASYCRARRRLPLAALDALFRSTVDSAGPSARGGPVGVDVRVLIVDGSSFSMPDARPLRDHFGLQRTQTPGVGYPVGKVMGLLDAATGLFVKLLMFTPFVHDLRGVIGLHESLRRGDILLGDRAFCSFAHLHLLSRAGVFGCFRLHQRRRTDRPGTVRWDKPPACPAWMDVRQFEQLPPFMKVRVVMHRIEQTGFRTREVLIASNLMDEQEWSDQRIGQLYARRWDIETCFNHLKTTMKLNVLRCQSVQGVMKELSVYLLVYNLVRWLMLRFARAGGVDVRRVSFIDAVRLTAAMALGQSGVANLLLNPHRPGRSSPRVVRRRPKKYKLMTQPRSTWKRSENQGEKH